MQPSEEKTKILTKLVDDFVKNPYDLSVITNFWQFLKTLPYGSVKQETLDALAEKANTVEGNERIATELSLYAIRQSAYAESDEKLRKMRKSD